MIGRVESALLQSRRFFSLVSKTRSARLGVSLVLIGGVLATRNASNTAACEGGSLLNLGQDPAKKKALSMFHLLTIAFDDNDSTVNL